MRPLSSIDWVHYTAYMELLSNPRWAPMTLQKACSLGPSNGIFAFWHHDGTEDLGIASQLQNRGCCSKLFQLLSISTYKLGGVAIGWVMPRNPNDFAHAKCGLSFLTIIAACSLEAGIGIDCPEQIYANLGSFAIFETTLALKSFGLQLLYTTCTWAF